MKYKSTYITLFLQLLAFVCQAHLPGVFPGPVTAVLEKAGKNRGELEKAIRYFEQGNDSLKVKAVYFLVANMDIHYSVDYYWADSAGNRVVYNELNYDNPEAAVVALARLKEVHGRLTPVAYTYRDIDTMKAEWLIENVEKAFEVWKSASASHLSFDDFCEYILPYRVSVEPLQNWRATYRTMFAWIRDSAGNKSNTQVALLTGNCLRNWFVNTYGQEERKEPLPRLGPLQLVFRKKGPCEDISDLATYVLRSQGVPISADVIPMWATSTGGHFTNTVLEKDQHPVFFDASVSESENTLSREPSKVIRVTYARQPETLAQQQAEKDIPPGFLRTSNYKDVTAQYWEVADVTCEVLPGKDTDHVVYACVFNGMNWKATWWGRKNRDTVRFSNMTKGVVYLPAVYKNGKLKPVGNPVALGYNNKKVLAPDTLHTRSITILEQEKYLLFREDKSYKLFYWNNTWKLLGTQKAVAGTKAMAFPDVPDNALLLLVPEYSTGKERPFMITENNKRIWW